ncbi:uncharacterized protein BJ171DRAFT_476124 [Polychytrium aggregatum]|uniref:uncharacterized protein n=1 Tax=Polychytrium aggregatum TaxID=110093 RepID=UPI0022FE41F2|nr:uncharacterized protein BJ171DRAFT_476124 [Polychytrium aggregatum]KAI9203194.1 hypothetical protein BJ171DRAFT_476124 [Polychytrium aggregatum]
MHIRDLLNYPSDNFGSVDTSVFPPSPITPPSSPPHEGTLPSPELANGFKYLVPSSSLACASLPTPPPSSVAISFPATPVLFTSPPAIFAPRRLAPMHEPPSSLASPPARPPRGSHAGRLSSRNPVPDRSFICKDCNVAFRRKQELHRHIRCIHGSETPWICPACTKGFARVDALRSHFSSKKSNTKGCRYALGGLPVPQLVKLSEVARNPAP